MLATQSNEQYLVQVTQDADELRFRKYSPVWNKMRHILVESLYMYNKLEAAGLKNQSSSDVHKMGTLYKMPL